MAQSTPISAMQPTYLNVALPVPLRRTFHYLPPGGESAHSCTIGVRVKVPFGRQTLIGIIVGHAETSEFADKIKPALEVLDQEPILPEVLYNLCTWAADYYHHPLGEVLSSALPTLLRQGRSVSLRTRLLKTTGAIDPESLNRAPRQRALLLALGTEGLNKEELNNQEFNAATIRGLTEKGAAEWQEIELATNTTKPVVFGPGLELSQQQAAALNRINSEGAHLLFGITGSGKTEVYLQAIEAAIKEGKQALVLVPEIGLTPQTIARFEQRFPDQVAAMHSGMTDADRLAAWRQTKTGQVSVVVGTRSAIFSPLKTPGLIVVDEEHDASFKQQDGFRYSARDLAVKRGQLDNVPVILGSATPSLETLLNADTGRYERLDLTERANNASFASYQIIGTEHQTLQEGFSPQLVKMMQQHLASGNQVLVFLNRRGFAPVLHCPQCGWLSNCQRCDGRMTYHFSNRMLICHHCDSQQSSPRNCPECGASEIVPLGLGTQRLENGLARIFPNEKILRIDRDSTRRKDELQDKLAEIKEGEPCILLGTQLLAKGHHFPDVTLVAVVDLDSGLFSSDYHAVERMGQLLLQVGGRAGREKKPGTVAVQTLYPDHPMLITLINDGYDEFCKALLKDREQSALPPYTYQAIIRAETLKPGIALNFLDALSQSYSPNVELLGPIPAPMEKRAGKFRAQLLISSSHRGHLHRGLKSLVQQAEDLSKIHKVRWSVDVDPYDLF